MEPMSSNDRPGEKELAQTFFVELIQDPAAQPTPALDPATGHLIREIVASEQTAGGVSTGQNFAAVSQRIRRNVQPPPVNNPGPVPTGLDRHTAPIHQKDDLFFARRPDGLAWNWNKFVTLAGLTATIILLTGLLVLSLAAADRTPKVAPSTGAKPGAASTSTSTLTVPVQPTFSPSPSPTVRPKPTTKDVVTDWLNPKVYLPTVLVDVAKSISLDPAILQKQMQSGMTLAEVASKQGFTLEQLKTIMLDSFKSQIEVEKNNGLITQTEADELYKTSSTFIDGFVVSQTTPTVIKIGPTPSEKG